MRRALILLVVVVVVGGAVAAGIATAVPAAPPAAVASPPPTPDATVLTVDGTPVPFHAIITFLARDRSDVVADAQAQGADVQAAGFWRTPVDGSDPARRLVDRARDDVVRLQVELDLAAQAGVAAPRTYEEVLAAWAAENQRRAEAIRRGQPVYGPSSMSESDFIDYLVGGLRQQVSEALAAAGRIDGTEASVHAYVEQHPDQGGAPAAAVRSLALEAQYTKLVDAAVAGAVVVPTAALDDLPAAACVPAGSC